MLCSCPQCLLMRAASRPQAPPASLAPSRRSQFRPSRRGPAPPQASGEALKRWPPPEVWKDFEAAHAGVWESAAARFSPHDGALQPLPDQYVPEAFREWGETVHEWQAEVESVLEPAEAAAPGAAPAPAAGLRHSLRRFWPTVGCEYGKNDVAETETRALFQDALPHFRGVLSDGSYSDSPHTLPAAGVPLRVEHCLYSSEPDAAGGATRMRLVYSIVGDAGPRMGNSVAATAPSWRLLSLEVFNERRAGAVPVSDAATATAASVEGWSHGPRAEPKALFGGFWEASAGAALNLLPSESGDGQPKPSRVLPVPCWAMEPRPQWSVGPRSSSGLPGSFLALPLGVWAYVEQATPEMLIVESGRALPCGTQRQVVACSYTRGELEAVTLGRDGQLALADAAGKGYLQSDDPEESAFFAELLREMELDSDTVKEATPDATLYSQMGGETREYNEEEDEEWKAARGSRPTREGEAGMDEEEDEEE